MATTLASAGLSGALFGAALAASGVFTPAVVLAQMRFEDFHMMKVFLTASAGSALIVNLFSHLGIARVPPRSSSSIGLFGAYDGNILGGLSIGFGMALAGACPGTVFVQVGAGVSSGIVCLAGGVIGSVLYATGLVDKLFSPFKSSTSTPNGKPASATTTGVQNAKSSASKSQSDQLTVHGKFNLSINTALLGFEVMCVSAITLVTYLFDENSSVVMTLRTSSGALHPVIGGALVASAQAASLLLTGGALGASAFYADAARYVLKALNIKGRGPGGSAPQTPSPKSIVFTLGIMGAGYLVSSKIPDIAFATTAASHPADLSVARSFLGGLCLAVGARLAGGCTSGHGISGMSSMSLASFVSVAAMFAGGMGLAVSV